MELSGNPKLGDLLFFFLLIQYTLYDCTILVCTSPGSSCTDMDCLATICSLNVNVIFSMLYLS